MVWKYIIISFLLVAFVFSYLLTQSKLNLSINYRTIVVVGFIALAFIISPLYWKAIVKKGERERLKYSNDKQPWE
jgi:uncharacterized membrane protein YciS (DUF1049 family)